MCAGTMPCLHPPGGGGEAARLHQFARCCCGVAGLCTRANRQDVADRIPRPLIGIAGGPCRQRLSEAAERAGACRAIEFRWAEGRDSRLPALAAELVRLKPDVIVTTGTPGSLAAKRATSTIPIVFASSGNPVAAGLVPSFSRPGGNITGFTVSGPELEGKRVQLLKEVVPQLSRVAVVWNSANPAIFDFYPADASRRCRSWFCRRTECRAQSRRRF